MGLLAAGTAWAQDGDGSIVCWGDNGFGQCNVPDPNADFVALAGGGHHSLGLKDDGSIVAWGCNWDGQCNVPEPNTDFTALAGGVYHSLGLKANGSIVAWGVNSSGQCDVPEPNTDFMAVAGGYTHSLGIKGKGPPTPIPTVSGWGLVALTLLILTTAKLLSMRRRPARA